MLPHLAKSCSPTPPFPCLCIRLDKGRGIQQRSRFPLCSPPRGTRGQALDPPNCSDGKLTNGDPIVFYRSTITKSNRVYFRKRKASVRPALPPSPRIIHLVTVAKQDNLSATTDDVDKPQACLTGTPRSAATRQSLLLFSLPPPSNNATSCLNGQQQSGF